MKKRIIALAVTTSLLLTACNTIDKVSQKVMDDIDKIYLVTPDDEPLIKHIEEVYATLTDKQKEQVKNYSTFISAKESLERIKKQAKKLNSHEKDAYIAVKYLKSLLKNPNSLIVHSIKYTFNMFMIEYSAQNGFGGNNRDNFYCCLSLDDKEPSRDFPHDDDSYNYDIDVDRVMAAFEDPSLAE